MPIPQPPRQDVQCLHTHHNILEEDALCNQQHAGASSSRSWGWALARFLSLLELLLLSSCSCFSALMMLFMSSQQGLRLTYSSVRTVLPWGSILFCQKFISFAFSLSKPLSNFAYQNCLERVVLYSVPNSGTLRWTRWNIPAFAQSRLWSIRVKLPPEAIHTWPARAPIQNVQVPSSALWEVGTVPHLCQAISPELHTAEGNQQPSLSPTDRTVARSSVELTATFNYTSTMCKGFSVD